MVRPHCPSLSLIESESVSIIPQWLLGPLNGQHKGPVSNNVDQIELKMTLPGQGKGCFQALKLLIGSAPVTSDVNIRLPRQGIM